jgi:Ca-activated chloride channel family protein
VYPKKLPDLYFGEPLQIALKSEFPITSVQITAETVSTPFYQQLIINDNPSSKEISSLWARRKIESLLDSLVIGANKEKVKSQVIATSLNHQIISPYTSFIAIEKPPEDLSLFAKNNLSPLQKLHAQKSRARKSAVSKDNGKIIQAHESLLVAMPQTAIGWQLQFLIGLALLLLVKIVKTTKTVSDREKPH